MSGRSSTPQSMVPKVFLIGWLAIILLAVLRVFTTLDVNSLWLDELFTAYFARPPEPGFAALLDRAAEDVHPPGYYAIVWATATLVGGEAALVGRTVSAVFAVLSVAALFFALPYWVSKPARIFTCVFAASTQLFFIYAQEARSYAMGWLLVIVLVAIAFRVADTIRQDQRIAKGCLALGCVGTFASLTHFYLVPITGACLTALLLLSRSLAQRTAIITTGIVVLAVVLLFLGWHRPQVVVDVTDTWFRATPDFLWRQTQIGVSRLLGSLNERSLLQVIAAATLVALIVLRSRGHAGLDVSAVVADLFILVMTVVIAIVMAVAVSVLYTPSYSFRFYVLIAPLYWLSLGLVYELILRSRSRALIIGVSVIATLIFAVLAARILWAYDTYKEPWREMAATIMDSPACGSAPLAVVVFDQPYISESEAKHFYGYYLPQGEERLWYELPRNSVHQMTVPPELRNYFEERITTADECNIILWSIGHVSQEALAGFGQHLLQQLALPMGARLAVEVVETSSPDKLKAFLGIGLQSEGFFLTVVR